MPSSVSEAGDAPLNVAMAFTVLAQEKELALQRSYFNTGVKSIDAHFPDLFKGGGVIGLGQIEGTEETTLITHVLATALVGTNVEVYIVTPPTSTIISDLASLLRKSISSNLSEEEAMQLLDQVRLLQYLDLVGLVEGVAEATQVGVERQDLPKRKTILLLRGLSSALATAQRRSGTAQIAALTANLMRSLRHLSRSYPHVVIVVEIGVEVGSAEGGSPIESAFASSKGEFIRAIPQGTIGDVLVSNIDLTVVVHDGFEKAKRAKHEEQAAGMRTSIVEIVKDHVDDRSGDWCIWVH